MSHGSYLTIYRRFNKSKASTAELDALKNEYFLANKKDSFNTNKDEEALKKDIPMLMHAGFKSSSLADLEDSKKTTTYYSEDGTRHERLLEFHFGSVFTGLREHFNINPYSFRDSTVIVSRHDAEKMLQAVEYILEEDYSKKFESILSNEYVGIIGEGYSPFDNRFKTARDPIYIDKEGPGYTVKFNDYGLDAETVENDDSIKVNFVHLRAALLAYLNAEECSWDGEELVLEYSAY